MTPEAWIAGAGLIVILAGIAVTAGRSLERSSATAARQVQLDTEVKQLIERCTRLESEGKGTAAAVERLEEQVRETRLEIREEMRTLSSDVRALISGRHDRDDVTPARGRG